MNRERLTPQWPSIRLGLFAFAFVTVTGYGADIVLQSYPKWMVADDVILGLLVGSLWVFYEESRLRAIQEKVRVIRDMNSYVRNELQVLFASVGDHTSPQVLNAVERCVDRIDWALREILPGRG